MQTGKLERLAAAGIQILPIDVKTHFFLERDGFIALVVRHEEDFGAAGAAGLLTEHGVAPLVWRSGRPFFVAKQFEREAEAAEIERLRQFQADLESALTTPS